MCEIGERGELFLFDAEGDLILIQLSFVKLNQQEVQIIYLMNRKQSHETTSQGYGQSGYKISYQINSPYVELLESKKKVYGHKFQHKANKSFTNAASSHHSKPSPNSISSLFAQGPKSFKYSSNEKNKNGRTATNEKKKRTRTEMEDKMHESLCVYPSAVDKNHDDLASKSLHYGDKKIEQVEHQHNPYFQELSSKKQRRKRHLSQNKYYNSLIEDKNVNIGSLENLQINDIEALISLIDNCVQQANEYIAYLSQKMENMKEELMEAKIAITQKDQELNRIDNLLRQKDEFIGNLERQIAELRHSTPETGMEIKNLLKVIEKMNDQNERLKGELSKERMEKMGAMNRPEDKEGKGKDYYNQIHSKIDILNISIDNNSPNANKDRREANKKYKFIKPKGAR